MKKNIAIIALAVVCVLLVGIMFASINRIDTMCMSEQGRPGIVGMEHLDKVKEIDERYDNDEIEIPYSITMGQAEGYWIVIMEGQDKYDDYVAFGMYDHMPTEKELAVLWANRMLEDEMEEIFEEIDF